METLCALSPEQSDAVVDSHARVLVLAGAGSGKTRVLVARVAHFLLERNVPPERLLVFSFTRKACLEVAHRLERLVREAGSTQRLPQITFTFHAYAFLLVRRYHEALGFPRAPRVVTEEDTPGPAALFGRFLDQYRGERPPGAPAEVFRAMRPGPDRLADPLARRLEPAFAEWKRGRCLVELDDLVPLALALLKGAVGKRLRARIASVFIDEFQDIDDTQHRMFEHLLGPETSFSIFGDDDQAIYRWRGSNPEIIRSYHRRCDVRTHVLATNYRCREPILALASHVVAGDTARVDKPAIAHRRGGARPRCVVGPNQPELVVQVLSTLHQSGRPLEELAVLVRDRYDGRAVARAGVRRGMRFTDCLDGPGVRLLTFHGSKGLEFPVVLIPFLDHRRFPNRRLLERSRDALKTRRKRARRAKRQVAGLRVRLALVGPEERGKTVSRRMWLRPSAWAGWVAALVHRLRGEENVRRWRAAMEARLAAARQMARWYPVLEEAWTRFPSEAQERLAEERRLCYVAMTRAKDELWLFCKDWRTRSEFLKGMPACLMDRQVINTMGECDDGFSSDGRRPAGARQGRYAGESSGMGAHEAGFQGTLVRGSQRRLLPEESPASGQA